MAQCVGQLSAQYLKRIAANVIGLRPKRSDGAACRTAQQTAALEDVKGGLRRRHGYARCLAQQLQDLHLHSFAFAAGVCWAAGCWSSARFPPPKIPAGSWAETPSGTTKGMGMGPLKA